MKKSLALLLSILLLFSLSACSESGKGGGETVSSVSASFESTSLSATAESTVEKSTAESSAASTSASTAFESTAEKTTTAATTEETESKTEKQTTKLSETSPEKTEPEWASSVCFVTIDCRNIKSNLSSLKKGKRAFVPESGFVLKDAAVAFEKGETAFDALKRACKENVCTDSCKYCQKGGIQLEFSFTPAYKSYYVEGIHQLYEKDCGSLSGWMYCVNGKFPDVASSEYKLENGDKITFAYTASMGDDLTSAS